MLLFLFFIVIIVSLYVILIWSYGLGFNKYPSYLPLNNQVADISATILITCRNPSPQIHLLLKQLECQLENATNIEVYVIDDFSDKDIILDSKIKYRSLSLKNYKSYLSHIKNNKKEAIALGVELSNYDYIICLDSDVTLSENWWKVVSNFIQDKKPKFTAGLHRYQESKTWLNNFLTLEQDILTASSIAALQLKIPTMCNGANMIFSKQAFYDVKGYDGLYHTNGGDDLLLYHRIYKKFPYDTHYIKNMDAVVFSETPKTVSELLIQRSRWISKTPHYENKWVNVQGGIILAMNLLCFLSLFLWILSPLILVKLMVDFYFISQIKKGYYTNYWFSNILIFSMIYPIYVFAVVFQRLFYPKG